MFVYIYVSDLLNQLGNNLVAKTAPIRHSHGNLLDLSIE